MWVKAQEKNEEPLTVGYRTLMKGFDSLSYRPQPLSDAGPLYIALDQKKEKAIFLLEMAAQEVDTDKKTQIITEVTGELYGKKTTKTGG